MLQEENNNHSKTQGKIFQEIFQMRQVVDNFKSRLKEVEETAAASSVLGCFPRPVPLNLQMGMKGWHRGLAWR